MKSETLVKVHEFKECTLPNDPKGFPFQHVNVGELWRLQWDGSSNGRLPQEGSGMIHEP